MSTLEKNTEYSLRRVVDWTKPVFCYEETAQKYGGQTDKNPRWKGDIVALLTTLIADPSQPAAERESAAEVLKYYLERVEEFREHPTVKALPTQAEADTLVKMLVAGIAYPLWEWPENWVIEEPSEKNQLKHRRVVRRAPAELAAAVVPLAVAQLEPPVEPPKAVFPPNRRDGSRDSESRG